MSEKDLIITNFLKLIDYYKYKQSTDPRYKYKILAFKNAIKIIKNNKDYINKPGIGEGIRKRIKEILETGNLKEIPKNIPKQNKLKEVIGIGDATLQSLLEKYNIKSIEDLKNNINKLPIQLQTGIKYYEKYTQKIKHSTIKHIEDYFHKLFKNLIIYFCGSYRRQLPYSKDIDVLIVDKNNKITLKQIVEILKEKRLIVGDLTYKDYKTKYMGFMKYKDIIIRIDIRLIPYNSLYYSLLYFTGSGDFNQRMRKLAKKLGFKLNEYGLFKKEKLYPAKSEEDIFKYLNLSYIPPIKRI